MEIPALRKTTTVILHGTVWECSNCKTGEDGHMPSVCPSCGLQFKDRIVYAQPLEEKMREFETGATRDNDDTKHDPEGFNSPAVELRFCEYMTKHRKQTDGNLRASDNWQKGIPRDAYIKSMYRHFMDIWLHHRGLSEKAKEPLEEALCALRFNVDGYLLELLKEKDAPPALKDPPPK